MQEHDLATGFAELLKEHDLVRIAPRQSIGAQHGDAFDGAVADDVTQRIEAGSVEPCAAVSLVAEDMGFVENVVIAGHPAAQGIELAVDGLLAFLSLSGDTGIDGDAHDGSSFLHGSALQGAGTTAPGELSSRRR